MSVCFPTVPPGPPTPWVVDTGKDCVIVAWKPPLYNGGGDILGYHVEKVNIDFTFSAHRVLIKTFSCLSEEPERSLFAVGVNLCSDDRFWLVRRSGRAVQSSDVKI